GRRRHRAGQRRRASRGRRASVRCGNCDFRARGPGEGLPGARSGSRVSLERALELAERGRGQVDRAHPLVGAVVVRAGEVVGEGWYAGTGTRHAEVAALLAAGERARGGTLYVTLEPCSHHGATPPCTDAVIDAGIARVVAGARDPNPKVDGKGFEGLRAAGVEA